MAEAFYQPLGDDQYRATPATEGPWSPRFQHGGPPTALLVRAMERTAPPDGALLTRVTAEFLAPAPVADLQAAARVIRDGRNVQLLDAELASDDRVVMRARAWRMRRAAVTGLDPVGDGAPPPFPDAAVASPVGIDFGYARAMEWRLASGATDRPGPATVWTRLGVAVVAGEGPSPAQRVVAAADSGSGVSAVLDFARWSFLNIDLTVHLLRPPAGEWVCLDSRTEVDGEGTGLATTALWDRRGRIGAAAQSLLVSPR